jgi:electron transfer DM13
MRKWVVAGATVVLVAVAAGMYWFQPWKLFTSKTVNDPVPVVEASTATPAAPATTAATLVGRGDLIAHEHATSGEVQLVRLANGQHQLIIRDLSTSDGPDLRVWLTDQPVLAGTQGWHLFDDGAYLELGRLKGNHGTQLYDIPAGTDLTRYRSVTIWCKRFAVSFGAAELTSP